MFKYTLLKNDDNFQVVEIGEKNLYNTDNYVAASDWVREKIRNKKTFDMPQIASFSKIKQKGYGRNTLDSLGYLYNDSNNVYKNSQGVCIVSSVFSHGHGVPICIENFFETISLFTARKLVKMKWHNEYDEYLKPVESEELQQFMVDSVVYSIFSSHSQQSSLRQVDYKNNIYDIKNNFFWMSVEDMKELSDNNGYDELYNDARTDSDRYLYTILFGENRLYDKLSPDTKNVLDLATNLVNESIQFRQMIANNENHLNSWDSGYAQLKLVWKEYLPEMFENFRNSFNGLERRMEPLVYELGFLKS
jgi:hypothetical protein